MRRRAFDDPNEVHPSTFITYMQSTRAVESGEVLILMLSFPILTLS